MLLYSKRKQLAELFEEWRSGGNFSDSPYNVIAFLYSNDLINEEKTKEFLLKNSNVKRDKSKG